MNTKLQRYRINNCSDIADDNGGYCLSEEVAKLEAVSAEMYELIEAVIKQAAPPEWQLIAMRMLLAKARGDNNV